MTASREMTPEEIAGQIVSRKRPRKWLAADLATIIERAGRRGQRQAAGAFGWFELNEADADLPVPALDAALSVARHFDEDAFACDFGGQTAINLPNLDLVLPLRAALREGETK